ncbi:MAG: M23 family metallopeptidase [Actinomycetes bacterium]
MKLAFLFSLVLGNLLFPTQVASEPIVLPIVGAIPEEVINQFEGPLKPYGPGHRGIDLPAEIGTWVIAPATGVITFSGEVGYRNSITIKFGSSRSASIEPVCSDLPEGTFVSLAEPIGKVCLPDQNYQWHCEISCIHFGTRTEAGYFSPLALIGGLPSSRLVPLGDQARG